MQLSVCPLQATGTEQEGSGRAQQISGPQWIYQQRSVALGPYPWGVRDLAQAWLVAVWVLNLDWVLY